MKTALVGFIYTNIPKLNEQIQPKSELQQEHTIHNVGIDYKTALSRTLETASTNYFQVLTAVAFFLTTASASYGNLYYDMDVIGKMVTEGNAVTGTFQISSDDSDGLNQTGFAPGSEQVTAAVAVFHLWDDYKTEDKTEGETVSINLGSENLLSASSNGYVFGFFGLVGGFANVNMLIDLNLNGELDYSVESTSGDFYLNFAKLVAETVDGRPSSTGGGSTRVPDGGATLAFLGLSVIGLACARRK